MKLDADLILPKNYLDVVPDIKVDKTTLKEIVEKLPENDPLKNHYKKSFENTLEFAEEVRVARQNLDSASESVRDSTPCLKTQSDMNCYDILEGLPLDVSSIIKQRFVENMTMKEIGSANGYSRETARRKLLKAVKICREKNKIQI